MDDYKRYQQSKNGSAPPPQQYGYDQKSRAPPPRGASSRGGPDPYDRNASYGPSSNSSFRSPSPNPPSYRSDSDRDRRDLFGDRGGSQQGGRQGYSNDRYMDQQDDRYGGRGGYGGSSGDMRQQGQYGGGYERGNPSDRYYAGEDYDAYGDSRFAQQQEEEEVEGIKQQIKFTKQDTLASTRNALNKIYEAENIGGQTMNRLAQQTEQLANVESKLDLAKAHTDRAVDKTNELKQLQRSMFMPVIKNPFTKKSRERREMEAVRQDHRDHAATRDEIRKFEYDSQQRIANLERERQRDQTNSRGGGSSKAERERYQFEADAEDDAIEDEIDSNLDALSAATGRLKNLALTMNTELDAQNKVLDRATKKVDPLSERITTTTYRINKIN